MVSPTLTTEEVQALYERRVAIRERAGLIVTTHAAIYEWSAKHDAYVLMHEGLRVQHRAGAAWSHRDHCFVPCACRWCNKHPEKVAEVDLYDPHTAMMQRLTWRAAELMAQPEPLI